VHSEGKLQVEYGCMKKIMSKNIININVREVISLAVAITNTRVVFLYQEVTLTCTGARMHGSINVKSPNSISKWQMEFNSAFKELSLPLTTNNTSHDRRCRSPNFKPGTFKIQI
jgi:hypothetical protein